MHLATLLAGIPEAPAADAGEVARRPPADRRVLLVLDDDPTGTQSVSDVPVLLRWDRAYLQWALRYGSAAVYVLTNTRSMTESEAVRINRDVAHEALSAAAEVGVELDLVSRSDSTLRGHFPAEPVALADELAAYTGAAVDGIVVVPAFPEAGRVTIGGVHYAGTAAAGFRPVGETEFAHDASFGYTASDLRDWVQEKSRGAMPATGVAHLGLSTLRTDHDQSVSVLRALRHRQPAVCDIAAPADLLALARAIRDAQATGSRFVFRVGPSFVRAMMGQSPGPPLTSPQIYGNAKCRTRATRGGLIVVGSHVSLTTRQLDRLMAEGDTATVELDVPALLGAERGDVCARLVEPVVTGLQARNVVLSTTRELVRSEDPHVSLRIARQVSAALVEVVRSVVAVARPRFVLAKGGITASDVAAHGLGISRAVARGTMLPGLVSLWEPVDGPATAMPFVVFPGNVGDDAALAAVVHVLSSARES